MMFGKKMLQVGTIYMAVLLALLTGCGGGSAQGGETKPEIDETPLSEFSVAYDAELQGAVIEKYLGSALKIRIPDTVEDEPIVKIGRGAFEKSNVMYVDIPDTVRVIGAAAFKGCDGMPSIDLPEGVTEIEKEAFRGCGGLTGIEIPSSVTKLGKEAFWHCRGLTEVVIPGNVAEIGDGAFGNCKNLTSVEILDGVTTIGDEAFLDCRSLTEVQLPNSVTSMGEEVFSGCESLSQESMDRISSVIQAAPGN